MGLLVKTLELQDFRSFGEKVVGLAPATTILCGPNAAGKTNTVEALQLLTAGYSFRHPTPAQLVREGAQAARASARLEGDGRVVDLRCDVVSGRRQFFRNGKRIQASEVSGTLMSVLFTPDDLQLVKRSASFRRDELDDFGRQANRGFASVLATYTRSIEQRNRLLKEERPDLDLLDAWDASVALGGATLLHGRLRLFERLRARVCEVYGELAAGERLECRYICSLGDEALGLSKDELRELFCARPAPRGGRRCWPTSRCSRCTSRCSPGRPLLRPDRRHRRGAPRRPASAADHGGSAPRRRGVSHRGARRPRLW